MYVCMHASMLLLQLNLFIRLALDMSLLLSQLSSRSNMIIHEPPTSDLIIAIYLTPAQPLENMMMSVSKEVSGRELFDYMPAYHGVIPYIKFYNRICRNFCHFIACRHAMLCPSIMLGDLSDACMALNQSYLSTPMIYEFLRSPIRLLSRRSPIPHSAILRAFSYNDSIVLQYNVLNLPFISILRHTMGTPWYSVSLLIRMSSVLTFLYDLCLSIRICLFALCFPFPQNHSTIQFSQYFEPRTFQSTLHGQISFPKPHIPIRITHSYTFNISCISTTPLKRGASCTCSILVGYTSCVLTC